MHYVKQSNYDNFSCIAGQCPESCCVGWQIVIDEDSLEKYEDVRELSLSLTCPEVVRMLFEMKEPLSFTSWDNSEEFDNLDDYADFDDLLYDKLLYLREISYKIAVNEKKPLKQRMEQLLSLAASVQSLLDEGDFTGIEDCLGDYENVKITSESYESAKNHFSVLYQLENLHDDWTSDLDLVWNAYFDKNNEALWEDYLSLPSELEFAGQQLLISLLYVYLCGAVYDDLIYSKAALCVYIVRWILLTYHVQAQDNAQVDWDLLQIITYRMCREIENSDPNLNALEEFFNENLSIE